MLNWLNLIHRHRKTEELKNRRTKNINFLILQFFSFLVFMFFCAFLIVIVLATPTFALSARGHYLSGDDYLKKGLYPLAINEYKKAIEINPYYKEAHHGLGKAYYAQGLYEEAKTFLNKAIELEANYWQAHNDLALVYERQGLLGEARESYDKALGISPQTPELHFNLARILTKEGKYSRAIERYQRVLRIDPGYICAYINLGNLYRHLENFDRAAAYYKEAARRDPKNIWAHIELGDLYRGRGWDERAVSEYRQALQILPDNTLTLSRLSGIYMARQEWDEAISINKRIIQISPKSAIAHYCLGRAYEKKGELTQARKKYEKALSIDPYNETARFYLENLLLQTEPSRSVLRREYAKQRLKAGRQYLLENRSPLAVYAYQRAILLSPQDPSLRFQLAELFAREQLINQTINELVKVRELDPIDEDVKFRLEQMYRLMKRSIAKKEGIEQVSIPPSGVRVLLVGLSPKVVVHPGISEQLDTVLSSLLNQFPQVFVVSDQMREESKTKLGIEKIDTIDDLFRVGSLVGAQFVLWGEVSERVDKLEAEFRLVDLATLNDIKKGSLSLSAKDRVESLSFKLASYVLEEIPLEGTVIKVKPHEAIVNLGAKHGLKVGAKLDVFQKAEVSRDPLTGEIIGESKRPIGQLEVTSIEDKLSKARILSYGLYEKLKRSDLVRLAKEKKDED